MNAYVNCDSAEDRQVEIRLLANIDDAAKALALSRGKIYGLLSDGRLERRKIGTRTLITWESIRSLAQGEA